MTPAYQSDKRQAKPFSAGVYLTELKRSLSAEHILQRYLTINKFLYHIRELRTDEDKNDFQALNKHIRQKGIPYGRTEVLFSAFKTIISFHKLRVAAKSEDRRLVDDDVTAAGFDEETYLRTMREVAIYLAWKEDLTIPEEISSACEHFEDDDIDIDEISRVTISDMADNQSERSPIIFIIDTSMPMSRYLGAVSDGFNELFDLIDRTPQLRRGAEVCVITTGCGAELLVDFTSAENAHRKVFSHEFNGHGPSHMDEAIDMALKCLDRYVDQLKQARQAFTAPWVIFFTGGRWLRNGKVNKDLDDKLAVLAHKCDPDIHDLEVHTVIPSPEITENETLMANINSLPGWKYNKADGLASIFRDIFKSIKIMRSEAPVADLPLKISGSL